MSDKMQGGILAGSTSLSIPFTLRKTSDGTEQTGKVAADMTARYIRQGGTSTALTALTDLAAVNSAFAAGGVKEIDSTNNPGEYRLDVDNAAFATGADWVQISVKVAACFVWKCTFPLTTNVIQTGDSFARIGAAGVGLTSVQATNTVAANITQIGGSTSALTVFKDLHGSNVVYSGTVTSGATGTSFVDTGLAAIGTAATDTNYYNGLIINFTSVIPCQKTAITGWNPTTNTLTFDQVSTVPTGATYYIT